MGMTRPRPPFAASEGDPPGVEADVVDVERDGLADADTGLEHQPDRLVAAVMQAARARDGWGWCRWRSGRSARRRSAG